MIQSKLANMYVTLNANRSYVYNVARALDKGKICPNVRTSTLVLLAFSEYVTFLSYILLSLLAKFNCTENLL